MMPMFPRNMGIICHLGGHVDYRMSFRPSWLAAKPSRS